MVHLEHQVGLLMGLHLNHDCGPQELLNGSNKRLTLIIALEGGTTPTGSCSSTSLFSPFSWIMHSLKW